MNSKKILFPVQKTVRKIPLRLILAIPFVLQIFAAVSLTGWLSLHNGQEAVNQVATQLRSEITTRIKEKLQNYLETPHLINQINANLLHSNLLNKQNLANLENHFWQQIQLFETVSYIYWSNEEGGFTTVAREENNQLVIYTTPGMVAGDLIKYTTDSQGLRHNKLSVTPNYDPRIRPWYQEAKKAKKPRWTDIYLLVPELELAISANQPFYDRNGQLEGILGTDLVLTQFTDFLQSLEIGRTGKTFILERSGKIVASSTTELPYLVTEDSEKQQRLKATESQEASIRLTTEFLLKKFGNLQEIDSSKQLDYRLKGQRQFVQVTPIIDPRGIDWLIVVVVPEADFMEQIQANTRTTILLCLAALFLATELGLITSRWLASPILKMSIASAAIAKGNLAQKVPENSVKEIAILANSFNQMAKQLQESFTALQQANLALEKTNEELENRVEARTAELKKAKETADAANRAKSEFLSNMSHELRTPLNAILGFTELLNNSSLTWEQQQEYLGIISRSGEHLLALINDVLEMSKIEAGKNILSAKIFDLYNLLDSLREMFSLRAKAKGLQLIFERDRELPQYVKTDEQKIRQVLINLLSNAIKFTEEGGVCLRVKVGKKEKWGNKERPAITNQKLLTSELIFEIEDTGVGINPEEKEKVFAAFMQTEIGKKAAQGTGLGLPISRKFVQLMGGEITFNSVVGEGTTFQFNISVKVAEAGEIPTKFTRKRVIGLMPNQPIYRILVVDDAFENRQLLVKILEPLGFEVKEASNGVEAIAIWSSWQPHLIWMDMRMPVMDGYEATKQIKSHLRGQATAIVALTASAFAEERSLVLSVGCDDFVRKPFRQEVLWAKMAEHLGLRYMYEEEALTDLSQQSPKAELTSESLLVMPREWIEQLNQAATKLNSKSILAAIAEIPDDDLELAQALTKLANNFRYDIIIDLTKKALSV
ncbi:MAG: response regulator [Kamptonema sp. SIO1D9]|nr:response regulator [Kamptonema sp. SIO1D9]